MTCVPSEDSYQPGHPPVGQSLRCAWKRFESTVESHSQNSDQTARSNLSLHWPHRSLCWFCRAVAHIITFFFYWLYYTLLYCADCLSDWYEIRIVIMSGMLHVSTNNVCNCGVLVKYYILYLILSSLLLHINVFLQIHYRPIYLYVFIFMNKIWISQIYLLL